ncbi:zonular occludens toxin domain-containing protein [Methylobacillus sp. Pita1]|uniref:zonular occludens toxin domain-containing protein n=1 Tax=Methylobacillus sp. Pita1 TaxID=3382642 RepID=UPI0038B57B44
MANWTLTGDLGAGKSIISTGKIMDFLAAGLPVATNMDIYPENFLPPNSRATHVRLPDFPSSDDLWALGMASTSRDESTFGLVALDELAVFLNSREWQGKARDQVIKYLRHVRKNHWHTLFITQDIESIDAQARRALIEHKVVCKRTDRLSIPFLGPFLRLLGLKGRLPQIHMGIVRYGKQDYSPKVDTWWYRGNKLYDAYNTDQVFTDEAERDLTLQGYVIDQSGKRQVKEYQAQVTGAFTVLSPWHLKGRYMSFYQRWSYAINAFAGVSIAVFALFSWISHANNVKPQTIATVPAASIEEIKGLMDLGDHFIITTKAGLVLESWESRKDATGTYYKVGSSWYKKPSES